MPRIKAFKAIRPAADMAEKVASVPYDVVNREEAVALANGNHTSFLHVIRPDIDLPPNTNPYADEVYATAATNLKSLIEEGALTKDADDCVFLYRQIMDGHAQVGLVCCSHIEDYENNLILKHEKTRPKKEDDRTRHVLTLNAHAGPVFLTYRDIAAVNETVDGLLSTAPLYDFTAPDGVQHTVWRIESPDDLVEQISSASHFYVADGHHRAASAWRAGTEHKSKNSDHTGDEEYNWFLTVLFPANQLKILAYNRVVRDLAGKSPAQFLEAISQICDVEITDNPVPASSGAFCVYLDGKWHKASVPAAKIDGADPINSLDVALLENLVLRPVLQIEDVRTDERIDFVGGIRGTQELEKLVDSGEWAVAFSMYPTSIEQLMAVSDAGEVMPPKSTWFEPKLRSGLFVHELT